MSLKLVLMILSTGFAALGVMGLVVWLKTREYSFKFLTLFWASAVLGMALSAITAKSLFLSTMVFCFYGLQTVTYSAFFASLNNQRPFLNIYWWSCGISILLSLCLFGVNAPFWMAAFPIAVSVGTPFIVQLILYRNKVGKDLIMDLVAVHMLFAILHNFLFPLLRDNPAFGPYGYMIGGLFSLVGSFLGIAAAMTNKNKSLIGQNKFLEHLDLASANLSTREKDVLQEILNGKGNPEIADALFISPNTVKKHVAQIYKKMGVKSRHELMARVIVN